MVVAILRTATQRLERGVAILFAGIFGAVLGGCWFDFMSDFGHHRNALDTGAGAVCGFAWLSALVFAIQQKSLPRPAQEKPWASRTTSAVLRTFAVLLALVAVPFLIMTVDTIVAAVRLGGDYPALVVMGVITEALMFFVPALAAFALWRLAGRRKVAAKVERSSSFTSEAPSDP